MICVTIVLLALTVFGSLSIYNDRKNEFASRKPIYNVTYQCGDATVVPVVSDDE